MKTLLSFTIFCLAIFPISMLIAQPAFQWSQILDGYASVDQWNAVTTDGSYIYATGFTQFDDFYRLVVIKYNLSGQEVIHYTYTYSSQPTVGNAITVKNGYVYVVGTRGTGTSSMMICFKFYASNLSVVTGWPETYSPTYSTEDVGLFVGVGQNDTVYYGGRSNFSTSSKLQGWNYVIVKVSPAGTRKAAKDYDGGMYGEDTPTEMIVDQTNNDVFMTGSSYQGPGYGFDYWTIKVDRGLNITRQDKYIGSGSGSNEFADAMTYENGALYVTGHNYTTQWNLITIKYNPSDFSKTWTSIPNTPISGNIVTRKMVMDNAYLYIAGDNGGSNLYIMKYSKSSGQLIAGPTSYSCQSVKSLRANSDGNIYVAGNYNNDFMLARFDANCQNPSVTFWNGPENGSDILNAMTSETGNLYLVGSTKSHLSLGPVTGSPYWSGYTTDFAIVKYSIGGSFIEAQAMVQNKPVVSVPGGFNLGQNYPNPFNPTTTIQFNLPEAGVVSLKIYDALGREVQTLIDNQSLAEGEHIVNLDASTLATGAYFYKINAIDSKFQSVKKMLFVK